MTCSSTNCLTLSRIARSSSERAESMLNMSLLAMALNLACRARETTVRTGLEHLALVRPDSRRHVDCPVAYRNHVDRRRTAATRTTRHCAGGRDHCPAPRVLD